LPVAGIALLLNGPLLLFLGGLLGGCLLRGCLLGCFLGCHFPILPFSMVCIDPAITIAVDECIDSRVISVKRKNNDTWKKRQQFFCFE